MAEHQAAPFHVLVLADAPFADITGGSHRVVTDIATRLAARGHRVTLVAPRVTPDRAPRELVAGVEVISYGDGSRRQYGPRLVAQCRATVERVLRDEAVDVAHSHYAFADTGFLLLPRWRALPLVRNFYGPWADEGWLEEAPMDYRGRLLTRLRYRLRAAVDAASVRRSERLIVLSNYSQRQLVEDYHVAPEKITIVPGGVDTVRFRPAADRLAVRRALGLPEDRPVLLTVRRLAARMGLGNLIAAMRAVVQTPAGRDALLVIAGKGRLRSTLEEQVAAAGLARHVRFAGFVPEEHLPAYYQAADLFVLPTLDLEGFGLIIGEALASGVPAIGTPVGAIPELLGDLDPRLLTRDSTPDALGTAMSAYLARPTDYPDAATCRAYAVQRYDWETAVVPAVEALLRQEVVRRQRQPASLDTRRLGEKVRWPRPRND